MPSFLCASLNFEFNRCPLTKTFHIIFVVKIHKPSSKFRCHPICLRVVNGPSKTKIHRISRVSQFRFFSGHVLLAVSIFFSQSRLGVPIFVRIRNFRSKSRFVGVFLEMSPERLRVLTSWARILLQSTSFAIKNSKYLELWEKNDILASPRKVSTILNVIVPFGSQERQIQMKWYRNKNSISWVFYLSDRNISSTRFKNLRQISRPGFWSFFQAFTKDIWTSGVFV